MNRSTFDCSRALDQRGHVIAAVLFAMVPIMALMLAVSYSTVREVSRFESDRLIEKATQAVLSASEMSKVILVGATYQDPSYLGMNEVVRGLMDDPSSAILRRHWQTNDCMYLDLTDGRRTWAAENAQQGAPNLSPFKLIDTRTIEQITVRSYIAHLTGNWYVLESETRVGAMTRTARLLFRERDPFTRFSLLVDQHAQPISVKVSGDVHSNQQVRLLYGGWQIPGFVSTSLGFIWEIGADWGNTGFVAGYEVGSDVIPIPDAAAVAQAVKPPTSTETGYEVAGDYIFVGSDFDDVSIIFNGSSCDVTGVEIVGGAPQVVAIYSGSLSSIRRIYTVGAITTLEGTLIGRLTVACESPLGVTLSGNLRYIDGAQNPATITGSLPSDFQRNPAYAGDSALGIIAPSGPILYAHNCPSIMEVDAALMSGGHVGIPGALMSGPTAPPPYNDPVQYVPGATAVSYDPTFMKDTVYTFGISISTHIKLRSVNSPTTWETLSGFPNGAYLYDRALLESPPPYFLDRARPYFKSVEILETLTDS